jgi:hypothetical protein
MISVAWTAPTGIYGCDVSNYQLEQLSLDSSSSEWVLIDVPVLPAYTISVGIVTGSEYMYRVRSINEIGASAYSDTHSVIAA